MAFGRSVVLARDGMEAQGLWEALMVPEPDAVESPLGLSGLVNPVAELLRDGAAAARGDLSTFFGESFAGTGPGRDGLEDRLDEDLAFGLHHGLWREGAGGGLELTGLGEALASSGVSARTVLTWRGLLSGPRDLSGRAAVLFAVSLAREWDGWQPPVAGGDRRRGLWPGGLRDRLGSGADGLTRAVLEMLDREGGAPFACHQAARRALILDDLLAGEAGEGLETVHGVSGGDQERLRDQASWLVMAFAEVAAATGMSAEAIQFLEGLAGELSRTSTDRRRGKEPETRLSPARTPRPRDDRREPRANGHTRPRLLFPPDDPGVVEFDGRLCELTPIQYRLLSLLAEKPGQAVSYEEIHGRIWPDAAVEQQQISFHRRGAEKQLMGSGGRLIGTRHGWGLVLKLRPEEVAMERPAGQETAVAGQA